MNKEICIWCDKPMGNSNNKVKSNFIHKRCVKDTEALAKAVFIPHNKGDNH